MKTRACEFQALKQKKKLGVNIGFFTDANRFKALAEMLKSYVKDALKAPGVEQLYMPGELEFQTQIERMKFGIPMSRQVIDELNGLARSLHIPGLT